MPSPWILASAAVTLAAAPVIGLFDAAAYLAGGDEATISRLSQRTAWAFPPYQWAVCFLFAVLCGHLFTTRPCEPPLPVWLSLAVLVALPYCVVLGGMTHALHAPASLPLHPTLRVNPLAPVVLSLVLGAVLGSEFLHQTGA
jgi:hypothetical protein